MTNIGTIVWAADESAAHRDALETTARVLGLTVQFCAPRDAAERATAAHARVIGLEAGDDRVRALALVAGAPRPAASGDHPAGLARRGPVLHAGRARGRRQRRPVAAARDRRAAQGPPARQPDDGTNPDAARPTRPARSSPSTARAAASARPPWRSTSPRVWPPWPPAEVALVDLDLQRGDVAAFLNLTPIESIATLAERARRGRRHVPARARLTRHAQRRLRAARAAGRSRKPTRSATTRSKLALRPPARAVPLHRRRHAAHDHRRHRCGARASRPHPADHRSVGAERPRRATARRALRAA